MTVVARLRSGIAGAAAFAILGIALAGTPDTSPVPKKDSMNMDYIPVCEDAAGEAPGTVKVSLDKVQRLGVRTAEVEQRTLSRTVRAFANLQFDERRQFV